MNVLITGINGFIGSYLGDFFLKRNESIIGIGLAQDCKNHNITYIQRDLAVGYIDGIIKKTKPEVIIHCAGNADVNKSIEFPEEDFKSNVIATNHLLYSIKKSGHYCKIIFLSSAAVYGEPDTLPISEECVRNPMSPYAIHKVMCEDLCLFFKNIYHYDVVILRIFSAYGPGLKKQLFWDMNQKIEREKKLLLFGNGKESRDFIFIDDLIDIIGKIAYMKESPYSVLNIANGKEVTINEVAEIFVKLKNSKISICYTGKNREGNPNYWCADTNKLDSIISRKITGIDIGISKYIKWAEELQEGK